MRIIIDNFSDLEMFDVMSYVRKSFEEDCFDDKVIGCYALNISQLKHEHSGYDGYAFMFSNRD